MTDCRNCGQAILYEPYYLDGKDPNPSRWFHAGGVITCSVPSAPQDQPWPVAEPADSNP